MSADWWQNFANNFAADLAPLLSLFGEQPSKQFLSETLDLVDIAIFSIAPIGVLTAVVSAIRVSEDPSLRAFIGRAQEGGAYAEAELCSSTSRDVCELYTTGGIARVFGRPKILEIVHDPSKDQDPKKASEDGDLKPAGIYTFEKYINLGEENPEWIEKKTTTEKSFAIHPNLSLNIGIKKLPRPWFYLAATLGLLLQGGVLVFAAIATYVYPDTFRRDDSQIVVPAFPVTLVGTILLCSGVGLCATVVENCTKERVFKRSKKSECRLHWIQPGGQIIGDQAFDSFAYSEKSDLLKQYIISWKSDGQRTTKKTLLVWAAIITTCVGFVLQFLGFRTLHSSVSVAQFVVMLVMSTVRALLRTQRLDKSDNLMGDSYTLYQGHELDWLSMKLAWPRNHDGGRGWTWQIVRPFERFSYDVVDISQKTTEESRNYGLPSNLGPELEKAFLKRARLARLTGAQSPSHTSIVYSAWDLTMIASRDLASSLAKSIEGTIALFYSECTIKPNWEKASTIRWTVPCCEEVIIENSRSQTELVTKSGYIRLTLSRQLGSTEGSWKADRSELEAALGLWLWSIRLKDRVKSPGERISEESRASFLPRSRIIFFHGETMSSPEEPNFPEKDSTPLAESPVHPIGTAGLPVEELHFPTGGLSPAEAGLKLWLGKNRRLELRQTTLRLPPSPFGPGTIVTPELKPRRVFGYHLLPKSAALATEIRVLEVPSESSLEMMCAQEIFSVFLASLSPIFHQIGGRTSIIKSSDKLHLENQTLSNMIRNFAASGIGSEEDALTCIVPILHNKGKLVHSMVFTESIDAADAYRRRNDWVNAEQVLISALTLSLQATRSYFIRYNEKQRRCLIALCDLYRWALLGDRHSRLFGLRGVLSICRTYGPKQFFEEMLIYRDVAFALCHHYQDDPAIQILSEELQAERGQIPFRSSWIMQRDLINLKDDYFPAALQKKDLRATLYLLKDKVLSFYRGPPAIALAAQNRWVMVLKNLLELGVNPEEIDKDGRNYLHYASQHTANPGTFRQLVGNQGYLLNRADRSGMTSLHLAAEAGHNEIAETLMDQFYLDPHRWDQSMRSSFEYGLSRPYPQTLISLVVSMVQRLYLSSSNVMCNTLMQIAILVVTSGSRDFLDRFLARLELERCCSVNEDIKKFLAGLKSTCSTLCLKFTKEGCFEFDFLQSTFYGYFGYDRMFSTGIAFSYKAKINNIPLAPFLENPKKITLLDDTGRSCLHYAIKGGNAPRIRQLLDADLGVSVNVEDKTGRTPLAYAFRNGNLALTTLLREYGAGVHKLPLWGSAIAAQGVDNYRLYFQDESLRIRELGINREGDGKADLSSEIAVAKVFTPLAIIRGDGHEREAHIYYISKENYICGTINDGRRWLPGSLNHKRTEVHPQSGLAAMRTDAGVLRVFYQGQLKWYNIGIKSSPWEDPSGDLTEIRSIDGKKWGSPTKIRKVPVGTTFTALTTPEGMTRIIFQGEDCPEEVYETYTENHTEWNGRVFVKIVFDQERFRRILSITAPSQPGRKVFWLDDRDDMHETTLTDDDHWEDSPHVDLVDAERFFEQVHSEMTYKIRRQLAVVGSEPILLYQKRDGTFYGISSYDTSWRKERMVIPAYDN